METVLAWFESPNLSELTLIGKTQFPGQTGIEN